MSRPGVPIARSQKSFPVQGGIAFKTYDIEKDKVAALRKRRFDPHRGVPFVLINGRGVYGYSERAYEQALKVNPWLRILR